MVAFAIITRSVSEVWERASLTLRVTMDRVSDASEDQLRNSYCNLQSEFDVKRLSGRTTKHCLALPFENSRGSPMRPDKYRKRQIAPRADDRLRRQIAQEAARRMYPLIGPEKSPGPLRDAEESDYYQAKRKAAAVLGHRVRPGDFPSDHEIREEVVALSRSPAPPDPETLANKADLALDPETIAEGGSGPRLADHLDRFTIYKLRLEPLESVKQNSRTHPEGDVLYHSLQVFELARAERPYDEEFLLAALLHDVGKGIDPSDPVAATLEALDGAIPDRTARLIAQLKNASALREGNLGAKARRALGSDAACDDLNLLIDLDQAGRVPGAPVSSVDEALAYLRGLEDEDYLEENG